jgi:non-homologous end joining protein Ku
MKATEVDGKLHFVDLNEVEEVRESLLEPKHMNVWAHEMANLYPSGTGYRFFPTKATKLFPLFLHLAKNFILVGSLNISKSEKLYRLDAYGTDIILQPVFFPADVSEPLGVEIEVEEATFDMALQLAHKNLSEFNPNSYLNTTDEKFVQLVESLALGTERPNHSIPKDRDSEDGLASLARALDL